MDIVEGDLAARFGPQDVLRHPEFPSGRIPDFIVHGPLVTWCVEVENSTDDLAEGVGQALNYAAEYSAERPAHGVVYLPNPVDDYIELQTSRESVRVVTLDPFPVMDD